MVTGYEVEMYRNITVMTRTLTEISKQLTRIADALEKDDEEPCDG